MGAPNPGEPDPSQAALKRLGYLSFDSNERSNHQARELKSVHVNVQAYYVRLTIHRCHVNKLNIYNQVSRIDTSPCIVVLSVGLPLFSWSRNRLTIIIAMDSLYLHEAKCQ